MFSKIANWTREQSRKPHAIWTLAGVSFVESSVFPIPPDIILIPMVIADPKRWWAIATVCTAASVLGGVLGYVIGMFFFDTIAMPALEMLHKADAFAQFKAGLEANEGAGFLAVFGAGLTPFPYKVITIASGAVEMALPAFIAASIASRGMRFFIEAGAIRLFGPAAQTFLKERMALASSIAFGVIALVFVLWKFVLH